MLVKSKIMYPGFLLLKWKKGGSLQMRFWIFSPHGVFNKILSDLFFFKRELSYLTFFFIPRKNKCDITTQLCLFKSSFVGISRFFKLELWLKGVGFKSRLVFDDTRSRSLLKLALGFSHILLIELPKTCQVFLVGKKKMYFKGTSLQDLTQLVSYIQNFKIPDVYKGKGLNYKYKLKKLKQGKKN